jgi:ATP-binding cassette subfamily B protein
MRLAYRAEPKLLLLSFALVSGSWVPDALIALWLKLLADGVLHHRPGSIRTAAIGMASSSALAWLMRTVGGRLELLFRERATIALEAHVAELQATVAGIEHHERPEYLNRLQLLRDQVFLLNHLYPAAMSTFGSLVRLVITVGLLMSVHPVLIALALFAVPTVLMSTWRAGVERKAEEGAAPNSRRTRHFYDLGTLAGPGKELRVSGTGELLVQRRRASWDAWFEPVAGARWASAFWHAGAWTVFGAAYVGAIVFVASVQHASAGKVLLVLAAGGNLSRYLGVTVAQADFLRWTIDAASRLVWLERYATEHRDDADQRAPDRLQGGIRFENVSFTYPGTDRPVLQEVELELPAGSVVAVVGENGAGKTTLVKLLCRFYEPTSGIISVDGTELGRIPADRWRERLAGAFQDFFRFELRAGETIGLGDLDRVDNAVALETAVARGGAGDVVQRLAHGLDTQLGPTWHEGVDLSFGQWQKLSLARGFMRDRPLLVVLDEPTAALDAETEHALFERFAAESRASAGDGRITVLVSHRFSTVRMADLIVVIDGSRVGEVGSHEALMAADGLYAELYGIQARAYR